MENLQVQVPGHAAQAVAPGTPAGQVLKAVEALGGNGDAPAVAAKLNGALIDLNRSVQAGGTLEPVLASSDEGREILRHTAAHVMAQAVKELFPKAKLAIGPAIADGFYYDFDVDRPFTPEDLEKIEAAMAKVVAANYPLVREEVPRAEALRLFEGLNEPYKVELVRDLPEGATISLYRQGDYVDLCAGPHLTSTGKVKAYKLLSGAGAYWRGDEKNPMLQRIYGTAFESKELLEDHLFKLEEAKRRDHRRLGKDLDLFSIHEEAGTGLIFWHPKGALVREIIENFWRQEHRRRGYDIVYSPHIARVELWKISGHWDWYKENMYSPMAVDEQEFMLKPMNCPFHIMMYKDQLRSYRDLPLRWGELGTVYRYERSGVLHGLLRVRGFTQDDAHIFCRPDQLSDEIMGVLDLCKFMMQSFGYKDYEVHLSVRDPLNKQKYAGTEDVWQAAEAALVAAMDAHQMSYVVDEGEAKFYGPAIDIKVKDALGRGWQGPTIQADFNLPERFGMTYIGEDGKEHRPVMIHRTVLGSMERFFGGLIEHYAGAFPVWLAPVQVRIMPITDGQLPYCQEVAEKFCAAGLRAEVDKRNEKIGFKIREAQLQKIPYMLVVGNREMESGQVAVRSREKGDEGAAAVEDVLRRVQEEAAARR